MAPIPASAARHATIPRWEKYRDDHGKVRRRTDQGRCCADYYYYSEDELETADALILLSLSRGGLCVSSDSTSDTNSGDSKINATEIPPVAVTRISRDENNPLVLRIRLASMPAKQIAYKCDKCDREFSSPQALGGHKTSHRRKPTIPDLNAPLRVFECSICGDVYDSGMALGGHKRKHRSK